MSDAKKLIAAFEKAVKDWNADGGPHEHTIKAGEELYFAAHNLIGELTDQRDALLGALQELLEWDEHDAGCIPYRAHLDAQDAARAAIAKATGEGQ